MSSQLNIYIDQGTDFRLTIDIFDDDDVELDISTYSFFGDIKKLYSEKRTAEFTFEKNAGSDADPNVQGQTVDAVTLILDADTTAQMKPGKYSYDVLMKKPTGEISKIVNGLAFVVSTITEV